MANTIKNKIEKWLFSNLNTGLKILRCVKPILILADQAIITRFDDVRDVLSRNDDFHVPYAKKMYKVTNGGNFFLGMQNSPTYSRDVSNMRVVARRQDLPDRIKPFIDTQCNQKIATFKGRFDLVQDLSLPVTTSFVGDYFGTPGWDAKDFAWSASLMFQYLFYDGDETLEKKALNSATKTRQYLDETIADRKNNRGKKDDLIERCLVMQDNNFPGTTDLDIRNNLIGLIIGAVPTNSKCVALTVDYLLDNPTLLAQAQQAALADDDDKMIQFVMESIRMNPFAAGIQRICANDCIVGRGYWRSTKISKGMKVIAMTQSAMNDHRVIKKPADFRLDRPLANYMHFGYSLHTCFGQYMNLVTIPGMVKAILKLKGLKRAVGKEGKMQMKGPFPTHLWLEYEEV